MRTRRFWELHKSVMCGNLWDMHNDLAETLIGGAEASELLKVDRSTISRWVKAGKLTPALKGSGLRGELFFHRADIDALTTRLSA